MKGVNYLIVGALLVFGSLSAMAQKITPVYTGMSKCKGLEKADSIKKDFLEMLNKVSCVSLNNSAKIYNPPDDKDVKFAFDSITFNISKKVKYSLSCKNEQKVIVSEYVYLLKQYQMELPNGILYWKVKDLEYAKRFADDYVYFMNMPHFLSQMKSKDFDSIATNYRLLKVKPPISEDARKYIVQANAMTQTKNYKKAIEYYDKAIQVEPANPMAYNNQALLYAMIGRYNEAIICMKKYLKLVPDAEDSRAVQDKIYEYEAMITK